MLQSFKRTATVEFIADRTDQLIILRDLPYIWIPALGRDADQEGIYAAMDYMRANWGANVSLSAVSATTSPVEDV